MQIIINNYNGYIFHPQQQKKLINPTLLSYLFDEIQRNHEIPKRLIDENVSLSDNAIKFAMKCYEHQNLLGKMITQDSILNQTAFSKKLDMKNIKNEKSTFIDYLFYVGALTFT